jgi:phosphate transport system substrate-binding protein
LERLAARTGLAGLAGAGLAIALALPLGGCSRRKGDVNLIGSTSVQPFAEMLAQEYRAHAPQSRVEVQGGGSTQGVQSALRGIADIGTCSRALKQEEIDAGLRPVQIARDGLAIVVHPSNPVGALTRDQVRRLFTGQFTNWNEVGGRDALIHLIVREEGSGTREAFVNMVMQKSRVSRKALNQESNGAVKELVKHDPNAIGFMSLGLVLGELKVLTVDGVAPSIEAVKDGRYPLVRPFLFVLKGEPRPAAQQFIDFVLSPEGQRLLEREGLVSAQ